MLNKLYSEFDHLADKYGLEKIKTIGDSYMAASGVPVLNPNNAEMAARFAIEAMDIKIDLKNIIVNSHDDNNLEQSFLPKSFLMFRCGIDCGPVVVGVIGEKKFIYDLWGDTVNIASRMESHGKIGEIQVTERFKNAIENTDLKNIENNSLGNGVQSDFIFIEREVIEVKGVGKMKTFFLNKNPESIQEHKYEDVEYFNSF